MDEAVGHQTAWWSLRARTVSHTARLQPLQGCFPLFLFHTAQDSVVKTTLNLNRGGIKKNLKKRANVTCYCVTFRGYNLHSCHASCKSTLTIKQNYYKGKKFTACKFFVEDNAWQHFGHNDSFFVAVVVNSSLYLVVSKWLSSTMLSTVVTAHFAVFWWLWTVAEARCLCGLCLS